MHWGSTFHAAGNAGTLNGWYWLEAVVFIVEKMEGIDEDDTVGHRRV